VAKCVGGKLEGYCLCGSAIRLGWATRQIIGDIESPVFPAKRSKEIKKQS